MSRNPSEGGCRCLVASVDTPAAWKPSPEPSAITPMLTPSTPEFDGLVVASGLGTDSGLASGVLRKAFRCWRSVGANGSSTPIPAVGRSIRPM